ncbi:salt tolerance down-regulator-domain-containing protein [Tricladium varicosporioides]|nr:salt tolerance down-regulator-domain-containing protein [Hymenoscyphus varicosporioides]
MTQTAAKTNGQTPTPPVENNNAAPTVNRKKQKRREKMAAKLAAEQPAKVQANGAQKSENGHRQMQELEARFRETGLGEQYEENGQFDPAEGDQYYSDEDGDRYSGSYGHDGSSANGYAIPPSNPGKKSKKKKKSKAAPPPPPNHIHSHASGHTHSHAFSHIHDGPNGLSHNHVPLPLPPLAPRGPGISKEKIWNTSSQEERERIKEFWLSLGEDERKSLVKVEKDAVLKKMKEQQKHSCSCTVCGRKRTAIEEELEVLYDAYYEELEQYANHQGDGGPSHMMPPPRRFGDMSGLQPPNRLPPAFNGQQPSRGRIVEQLGDDDEEEVEETYSDEEVDDEEDYSDEEPEELPRNNHARDFFSFGNSLTVQGGILTVADDLLKNDGKKFIEMMEQLAERRMAREEDAREQFSNPSYGHPPNGGMHPHSHAHNHPPPPDDEAYDEEDEDEDDEYDSQDEEYDEEEMDTMTEEQRMEEGRRMFQIFAARMFEQRVLTAYKEKVAKERQQKLLEELEEEGRAESQKKAKKAKDAQKKKDKLAQKKQALAEEKAKREAEKAAEEAALRAAEEKKAEEARLKAEEKRKKKEAQKKAEEEERLRKEAEKQRRLQEQRDRQAELERKQREAKEKERKEKEELRQKEREAKETKEREAKERREKQERDKREKEARVKAEREAREKQKREDLAAQQATTQATAQAAQAASQASKRAPVPVPIPANLQSHATAVASPHIPVATPAIPKAPTPIKLRTGSQQGSTNDSVPQTPQSSGLSQNVSPIPTTPSQGSPGPIGPQGKNQAQHPFLHHPQAISPTHAAIKSPPGMPGPFAAMQPMGMGFQPGMPPMIPGFGRMHHDPMFPHQAPMGGPFRPLAGPNGIPIHPGMNMHQFPQGRGFPMTNGPPGFPQMPNGFGGIGQPFQKEGPPSQVHSRQQSASYEKPFEVPVSAPQAQPIARPGPIGRPSSVVHGQRQENSRNTDVDDVSNHLGSSALLDDSDEPINPGLNGRRSSGIASMNARPNFAPIPFGMDPSAFANPMNSYNTWGGPPNPFGSSSLPGYGGGWGQAPLGNAFGGVAPPARPTQPRSVAVRLMICRACKNMEGSTPDGFYDLNLLKEQVDHLNPPNEQSISEKELLDICETEGNGINGGGSFEIRKDGDRCLIRHENEVPATHRPIGAPGEIGSPIVGGGGMPRFAGPPPGF